MRRRAGAGKVETALGGEQGQGRQARGVGGEAGAPHPLTHPEQTQRGRGQHRPVKWFWCFCILFRL